MLARIDGLDLTLTTNGALLPEKARALKEAGLRRVTVSLDSLDDNVFRAMNDVDFPVQRVLAGIDAAARVGLNPIKINMVVKRGVNEHSILPMARYFRDTGHILRCIEYMDVGHSNGWRLDDIVPAKEILSVIHAEMPIEPIDASYRGEVARRWRYRDGGGEIGIIASVTQPFCRDCSRARLSADGQLFTCLFATTGRDLRSLLRGGVGDVDISEPLPWCGRTGTTATRTFARRRPSAFQKWRCPTSVVRSEAGLFNKSAGMRHRRTHEKCHSSVPIISMEVQVSQPLKGRRIALAEARELDLLAGMFQRAGADVLRSPLVAILDAPDSAPIEAWIRRAIAGNLDVVILYTGEGLRRLLGVAERAGLREEFVAALGQVRKLTRGPKPVRALREIGLSPELIAKEPTTDGIIVTLEGEALDGRTIGVQIYGEEPNLQLVDFLQMRGAKIDLVAPYVYASAAKDERVDGLICEMANGRIDAIAFTSSPQVQRLAKAAEEAGLSEILKEGFRRTKVVAIGPVVGEELSRLGISPDAMAGAPYAMKPLLGAIQRLFSKTR